jgi:Na+/proline symporter
VEGISFMVAEIGNFLQFILIGYFFANKIHNYKGLSLGELIENNYGKLVSKIVLNCGLIYSIAFVSMEFSILKSITQEYFDINTFIVISVMLVVYSSFGGLKSVILSDIVYLGFFSLMIMALLALSFYYIDFENLKIIAKTDQRFSLGGLNDEYFAKTISLFIIFLLPCFDPAIFQRLSICKSSSQVKICFFASSFCFFIIQAILSFVALFLISKEQNLDTNNIIFYLVDNYSKNYILKFIMIIGIISVILSTVNSYINAGFVGYDKSKLGTKLSGIFFGLISIAIALKYQNLFQKIIVLRKPMFPVEDNELEMLLLFSYPKNKKAD